MKYPLTFVLALSVAVFGLACGGSGSGAAEQELADACATTTNMDEAICECVAEAAAEELTPEAMEFLVAAMSGNEALAEELREGLDVADAMQAGMFMTGAPADCALSQP